MAAERLTIVFADVSESTAIYESLGDAHALALVKRLFDTLTAKVVAGGGTIVKTLGDGMVCRFEDPERAFETSCEIQEAALAAEASDGPRLALKVGLNWGPVVLERGDVFGDTVNVCARLAGLAGPHQVLTTQETIDALPSRLRSRTRKLHAIKVRGRLEAVKVWEVLWRSDPDVTEALTRSGLMHAAKAKRNSILKLTYRGGTVVVEQSSAGVKLGRDKANDVVVSSGKASRVHARIFGRGGHFVILDLSSNGTYVAIDGAEEEIVLLREETVLGERGAIGLGGAASKPGDHVLRYRLEELKP